MTTHTTIDIAISGTMSNQFALINLYFFQIVKERTANDLVCKNQTETNWVAARPTSLWFDLSIAAPCSPTYPAYPAQPHAIIRWWRLTGSNRRPPACKAGALPAELNPPGIFTLLLLHQCFCISASASLLSHRRLLPQPRFQPYWWVWLGSNQRPPRYQHGALTN